MKTLFQAFIRVVRIMNMMLLLISIKPLSASHHWL
jgi:hypothetical protein